VNPLCDQFSGVVLPGGDRRSAPGTIRESPGESGAGPRVERGARREIVTEGALVALTYVASLAIAGFGGETRRAYASQAGLSAKSLASEVAETSGRRATKVDPDGPLSSTVSVP